MAVTLKQSDSSEKKTKKEHVKVERQFLGFCHIRALVESLFTNVLMLSDWLKAYQ